MGCPPDPYDVELSRRGDAHQALAARGRQLAAEFQTAFGVFEQLVAQWLPADRGTQQRLAQHAQRGRNLQVPVVARRFHWGDVQGTAELPDLSAVYSHMSQTERQVRALERALCELRGELLATAAALQPRGQALVEAEIVLHLQHRREDRADIVRKLGDEVQVQRYGLDRPALPLEDDERRAIQERLDRALAQLRQVEALTDEDLVAWPDRLHPLSLLP
jgi:hypothetical protein